MLFNKFDNILEEIFDLPTNIIEKIWLFIKLIFPFAVIIISFSFYYVYDQIPYKIIENKNLFELLPKNIDFNISVIISFCILIMGILNFKQNKKEVYMDNYKEIYFNLENKKKVKKHLIKNIFLLKKDFDKNSPDFMLIKECINLYKKDYVEFSKLIIKIIKTEYLPKTKEFKLSLWKLSVMLLIYIISIAISIIYLLYDSCYLLIYTDMKPLIIFVKNMSLFNTTLYLTFIILNFIDKKRKEYLIQYFIKK